MSVRAIQELELRLLLSTTVIDLNLDPASSNVANIVDLNGVAIFAANDGEHGAEVWRSDGTSNGTFLLQDISFAQDDSRPQLLGVLNNKAYFCAMGDGPVGLWQTDGTRAGTYLLKALPAGLTGNANSAAVLNGKLYFAPSITNTGTELWVTDGTAAGTVQVKDINPGSTGSEPDSFITAGGLVYFVANDGVHGRELWRSDGTATGTYLLKDINAGTASSNPDQLTTFANTVYFRATEPTTGTELWRSDGTGSGTALFHEGTVGPESQASFEIEACGSWLYFNQLGQLWRTDGSSAGTTDLGITASSLTESTGILFFSHSGVDLCRTQGNTTTLLASFSSSIVSMYSINGALLFTANSTSTSTELWRSDGTAASTKLIKLHNGGTNNGGFTAAARVGNRLFYSAQSNADGAELFCSDGTSNGTGMVKNIRTGTNDSSPGWLVPLGNQMLFAAYNNVNTIWRTSGETAIRLTDLPLGSSLLRATASLGNRALFTSRTFTPSITNCLWSSDGTPSGTTIIATIPGSSTDLFMGMLGNYAYFNGVSSSGDIELWRTDGTAEGTGLFKDLVPGAYPSKPSNFITVGDKLFFQASSRLWVTDGTEAGTKSLVFSGSASLKTTARVACDNLLFFSAYDENHGSELWKTDGTSAGTVLVSDINLGSSSSNPDWFADLNGTVYFVANDGTHGEEIWKSDGTPTGTSRVTDLLPGTSSMRPTNLTTANGLLFFIAFDQNVGESVWRTDTTETGTLLLADLIPSAGLLGASLTAIGDHVYFSADDSIHGMEPWRTDGTPAGTLQLADVYPGPNPSDPGSFFAANNSVYATAKDLLHGRELWRFSGDFAPPTVSSSLDLDTNPMSIKVVFGEPLASAVSSSAVTIVDKTFYLPVSSFTITNEAMSATIALGSPFNLLANGNYRMTIAANTLSDVSGNTLLAAHVFDFYFLNADANRDRIVDTQDFNLLASNFGGTSKVFSQGDFDYSSTVNSVDFNILVANYGTRISLPSSAPLAAAPAIFGGMSLDRVDDVLS